MRIGSLCSGYGGLDHAVSDVFGADVAWFAEYDRDPSRILAHHYPHIPNHGDLTTLDWASVEPVDLLIGGIPCQPFSDAGNRLALGDPRHLWPFMADGVRALRPRYVVVENVSGFVRRGGLSCVLTDLAALGYDATWASVRASDVGAPHQRERVFLVAADARRERHGCGVHAGDVGRVDGADAGPSRERERPWEVPVDRGAAAAADADGEHEWTVTAGDRRRESEASARDGGRTPADTARVGRGEGRPEPARLVGPSDAAERGGAVATDADRDGLARIGRELPERRDLDGRGGAYITWGDYEPAIHRWERVLRRPAPVPTEPGRNGPRLSPRFVEWLMGLPAGWVTDVPGLSRNAQLKALGNGVVPQQAALALSWLLAQEAAA